MNNKKTNFEGVTIVGLMEDAINNKFLEWDGSNIESFADSFSIHDLSEMDYWAHEFAGYCPSAFDEFPDLEWEEDAAFPISAKLLVIKNWIACSLTLAVQNAASSEMLGQEELVSHLYNLWMAVRGN